MALFGTAGVIYFGTARQILLPLDPKHSQSQVHSWGGLNPHVFFLIVLGGKTVNFALASTL